MLPKGEISPNFVHTVLVCVCLRLFHDELNQVTTEMEMSGDFAFVTAHKNVNRISISEAALARSSSCNLFIEQCFLNDATIHPLICLHFCPDMRIRRDLSLCPKEYLFHIVKHSDNIAPGFFLFQK